MLTQGHQRARQTGVGLVELMIGLAVGLVIVGAAVSVYVTSLRGGSDVLRSAKLNIELRGAMDFMGSEIRRAGFWPAQGASLTNNPFTASGTDISSPASSCVLFSYDKNGNQATDSNEFVGFKLNAGAISIRYLGDNTMADDCADGSWESITDPNTVVVDSLSFSIVYQCVNAASNASDGQRCVSGQAVYDDAAAGAKKTDLIEIRLVTIDLQAHHAIDAATKINLSQTVYLRNNRIQTVGT